MELSGKIHPRGGSPRTYCITDFAGPKASGRFGEIKISELKCCLQRIYFILPSKCAEVVTILTCFRGCPLQILPGYVILTEVFRGSHQYLHTESGILAQIMPHRLPYISFTFIIHNSSYHLTPYSLRY
jgi:hypothetical protein